MWSLKRNANYGSKHLDERALVVTRASIAADGKSVTLEVPELQPTWCMEIKATLRGFDNSSFTRTIHNSIHSLGAKP
jgi:hypothetical protein